MKLNTSTGAVLTDGLWDNIKNDGEMRDEKQKITGCGRYPENCDYNLEDRE